MHFNEYQTESRKTAKYPNAGSDVIYPTLGLAGETGEVAEKIKKMIRDEGGELTEEKRELLKKELGDVLWYLTRIATELGFELRDVAQTNLDKLFKPMEEGKIGGSGDNR